MTWIKLEPKWLGPKWLQIFPMGFRIFTMGLQSGVSHAAWQTHLSGVAVPLSENEHATSEQSEVDDGW